MHTGSSTVLAATATLARSIRRRSTGAHADTTAGLTAWPPRCQARGSAAVGPLLKLENRLGRLCAWRETTGHGSTGARSDRIISPHPGYGGTDPGAAR